MKRSRLPFTRLLTTLLVGAMLLNLAYTVVQPERVEAAAGAPLLILVDSATNPFGSYIQEILNAEGVKDYELQPLSALNSALLTGRRAVILGESSPSGAQIALLDNFVSAGGGLVAMRPVAGLDTTLGVTRQGATTADGYMRIIDPALGAGLYGDTMQFHGTSSQYTLNGAAQIAELYSGRTATTGRPAVTLANRGSGKAAMFSYDLARSVALTRQGNPANANFDIDGDGVIRSIDLFKNWIDLERTRVPQADMQQRLLVRLVQTVMAQPVPRLWYFPQGAPTVVVITADAHANPNSYYQSEIDDLAGIGATATFYLSPAGNPSAATLNAWKSLGYDFAPHPYVDCGYDCGFDNAFAWFENTYGFAPRTVRTHQVRWSGWADAAAVGAQHGVGLDFNTYQWGPWMTTASGAPALGYLSGSGQPMRFVEASGNILPIYQQHTLLVDEELAPQAGLRGLSLSAAVAASRQVIDESVGGYHTPITTQYHVDYYYPNNSDWAIQSTQYAMQQGALSLNADTWLTFIQQRAATAVTNSAWSNNQLTFTVGSGGTGQRMLVPLQYGGNTLTGITIGGASASFTTLTVNGAAFAAVNVQSGNYVATYAPDTTAPTVTGTTPAAGATGVPTTTPIGVTFSEAMNRTAAQGAFSLAPSVAGTFSWDGPGSTMTFTPSATLAASTTYNATVSAAATDLAGNPLASAANWSFTTAGATPPPAVTGVSPISGPVAGGTAVTISGTGFTGATAVAFGGTAAAGFTVNSATQITATAPAHAAGTVDITVTTPAGTSAITSSDRYTYVDQAGAVAVTAVDAGTGTTAGGTVVTITGANFATGATVSFGGTAATGVTVTSTTSITATTPARAAGAVNVVVTNPGGQGATLPGGYRYVACPTGCFTQTTGTDFATGTPATGVSIVQSADGALQLTPAVGAEFSGTALPAGWSAAPWTGGGGATVSNGNLTVDAALVATDAYYSPGRVVEFVATFNGSAPFQHIGLGNDLNNTPWAIFSTGSLGGALQARTNSGAGETSTPLGGNWLGAPHLFRIEWTGTSTTYSIDGTQVAVHNQAIPSSLRPVISDGPLGNGTLVVDWFRVSPYAPSGVFTSRVFDAAGNAAWGTGAWSGTVPGGTSLAVGVRTGNTPTPDGNWSAYAPLTSGATIGGNARYLQYQVTLATTDPNQAPLFRDLAIGYTVSGPLAPTIAGAAPASGPATGGTVVTITGANYVAGATVTFGGAAASGVTVVSATQINATAPAHAAGSVDIVVTNTDGRNGTLPGGFIYVAAPPAVTGVSPAAGSTAGGTVVTLAGTGFAGATAVAFGGVPAASFTVNSDSQITATAPGHAAGTVNVTVTTPAGTSPAGSANEYVYQVPSPAPQVQRVTPGTGTAAGGTTVVIAGANFGGATSVTFGGIPGTALTVTSPTSLTVTTPAHAAGAVDVRVTTPGGTSPTNPAARFAYVACPNGCVAQTTAAQFAAGTAGSTSYIAETADGEVILAPAAGAEFGGTTLPAGLTATPWGTGGAGTVGGGNLTVDGALVAGTSYVSPGRVLEFIATFNASAPFQHAGLGIDLNNTPWAIFSTGSAGGALYARTITSTGQTDTLLAGNWLGAPHRFRIEWATSGITYLIDGTQVASHPLGTTGDLRLVISDGPVGGGTLSMDWLRLGPYAAAGTHTSGVLDAGGPATWQTAAWTADVPPGTGLAVSVRTGNTATPDGTWAAFATVTNGGTIGATGRYAQYQVSMTTSDPGRTPALGDITLGYSVSAPSPPAVTGLSPSSGSTAGGTTVIIAGAAFTGATAVSFGGTAATGFTVDSATSITATAPAHAAGTVNVTVTTPGGTSATGSGNQYTYTAAPTVSAVSPTSGPVSGGTAATITGTNFVAGMTATFGGTAATNVTVVSATSLTVTTPAHSAGAVTVTVTNPNGQSGSRANGFTYFAPPTIATINPAAGPIAGNTLVTITGTSFASGSMTVTFDGLAGTSITVQSATQLRVRTPAHAAATVAVVVARSGVSSAPGQYSYAAPPTVGGVSPNTGPLGGGTPVTLTGTNFTGATAVRFGTTDATSFTVVSATTITAVSPARPAGTVNVRVVTPGGTSATAVANRFTYSAGGNAPTVAALGPGTPRLVVQRVRRRMTDTSPF